MAELLLLQHLWGNFILNTAEAWYILKENVKVT